MNWYNVFIQAIGFISSGIFIWSYQIRSPQKLILAQLAASAIVAVHYFLLGQWTGCALNLVCAVRAAVCASDRPWTKSRWTLAGLLALALAAGILSWQGPVSLLPLAGMISGTISIFSRNARIIRIVQMSCTSPVWLIYNILAGSISGSITDSFNIVSVVVSLIRFGWTGLAGPEAPRKETETNETQSNTPNLPDGSSESDGAACPRRVRG